MLNSILNSNLTLTSFLICTGVSLILGIVIGVLHQKTSKTNKNFVSTLATLPALVTSVIMMINGNLGTGIAVAGAFSLVRFRSIAGNSREILNVFFAMAVGLACGTGYVGYAIMFTLIVSIFSYIIYILNFGESDSNDKLLKIVIPENLDYTNAFNDIFKKYVDTYCLVQSKTTNMGSLFELTYQVKIKKGINEKAFIDDIRIRNGNLKVMLSHSLLEQEL